MKLDRMNNCLIDAILSLVTATAGCMVSIPLDSGVDWVAADEHRIAVASEIFESTTPIRVKYTDAWQTEEYVLFRSGDRQLEIIYAQAGKVLFGYYCAAPAEALEDNAVRKLIRGTESTPRL